MKEENLGDMEPGWLKLKFLQERLGHKFRNGCLLERALTHTSWANEAKKPEYHNERQEFLGDAVLELAVSTELYNRFPNAREGDLTRLRARLVSGENLAKIARGIGLEKVIKLGAGEEKQGGRERDSILSDALEAILGAIYEDAGFSVAQDCVNRIFSKHWPDKIRSRAPTDSKSRLQQLCLQKFRGFPVYALVAAYGAEHEKKFEVSVTLPDGQVFQGDNFSCKKAQQDAARKALEKLERDCP